MINVYLEVDDAAFEWLRSRGWSSRIGASLVFWRAPNIEGLTGVFKPDEDVHKIKESMIEELNNITVMDDNIEVLEQLDIQSKKTISETTERQLLNVSESSGNEDEDPEKTLTAEGYSTPPAHLAATMKTPLNSPETDSPNPKLLRSRHNSDVTEAENYRPDNTSASKGGTSTSTESS